jgi:Putative zinc-finger
VSQDHARSGHVTDEDLMLDYYGERSSEERAAMRAHLDVCDSCRALERELRGVLALVDTEQVPEAPAGFEREMWARLEPQIAARTNVVSVFLGAPKPRSGEGPQPDLLETRAAAVGLRRWCGRTRRWLVRVGPYLGWGARDR